MSFEATNVVQASTGDLSYRRLFSLEGFTQLALGTLLARTAGALTRIALVLFVLQRYHSPALAGFATFLAIMPGLIVSPIAGALLDRHGRLRLILADYVVAALSLVLLASLSLAQLLGPEWMLAIIAFSSLTGPLSMSGTRTLFPLVVPRELWDRANAVDSGTMALASVVGPALAGFFVAWVGGEGAFLINALVYLASGVVILRLRFPEPARSSPEPLLRASGQALIYVVRHPTLRGVVFTLWMANIPFGILTVALPVLVLRSFHWGADGVGVLWSVAGIATIIAGVLVGRVNSEGRERAIIAIGMGIATIACMAMLVQTPIAIFVALALFGLASGPIDIGLFALRQRRTDPRWFGRVFAVSMSLNFAGVPVGSALAGAITEHSIFLALLLAAVISVGGCAAPFLTIPGGEHAATPSGAAEERELAQV